MFKARTLIFTLFILLALINLSACKKQAAQTTENNNYFSEGTLKINPISHATSVISWDGIVVYTDPVGGKDAFLNHPSPDLILITDIHGDHLSVETLQAIITENTSLIAPEAVIDQLPSNLSENILSMANGDIKAIKNFSIEAIPMYNLPESDDSKHVKGRGNGYVLEKNNKRLYISGDTAGIPEMRELKNIDIALLCMNLPYTMSVDEAADATLDFQPKIVLPYHYRGKDGLSDVSRFKELVNEGNASIKVIQLDWYAN